MQFLKALIRKSRSLILFIAILGIFNSLLNSGLLVFINSTISGKPLPVFPQYDWQVFVVLILVSLLTAKLFQTHMIRMTNNLLFDFEMAILNKLKHAPYEDFEILGNEKVYTVINDTKVLGHVPEVFMTAFNAFLLILCCFTYLFIISPPGAFVVLAIMLVLLVFYLVRNRVIENDMNRQRDLQNVYYKHLGDMLSGFKELKLSIRRNLNIFNDYLVKNRVQSRDISVRTSIRYMDNELIGTYSWYVVFGVIMFVLPRIFGISLGTTSSFLITILYMVGPIAVLITLIPTYTQVKISVERINMFDRMLDSIETMGSSQLADTQQRPPFESIRFENVTYQYKDAESGQSFVMEPVTLTIGRGELIYVIGGNGSGKSTFGYLLTGLYRPHTGHIYLNEQEITADFYQRYSDMISAVFTNNYLFSENYDGFELNSKNKQLMDLVKLMRMENKLKIDEEANRIDKKLSKGQQKRLALLLALMENKDILVLDEWAAEQDPSFRNYFYKEILPLLKKEGKTVVVITHDDDYYGLADRIIKFNFGRIVSDKTQEVKNAAPVPQD